MSAKNLFILLFAFSTIHNTFSSELRKVHLIVGTGFICYYLDPDIARLNGQDIKDNLFAPGNYELYLEHEGFHPLRKFIEIPSRKGDFRIETVLKPKKRRLVFKIGYDVPANKWNKHNDGQKLAKIKLGINVDAMIEFKTGDYVQPGDYDLEIQKNGYKTVQKRIIIPPGISDYNFFEFLRAKRVHVNIFVTYSVKPKNGKKCIVTIIQNSNKIGFDTLTNNTLRPGRYLLTISKPGYARIQKEIAIPVSEKRYDIYETLIEKK